MDFTRGAKHTNHNSATAKHNPPGGNICALCTVCSVAPSLKQTASGFIFSAQKKVIFLCALLRKELVDKLWLRPPGRRGPSVSVSWPSSWSSSSLVQEPLWPGTSWVSSFFFSLHQLNDQLGFPLM